MLDVYSVVSFATSQRTREVGLRMALVATKQDVVRQITRQGVLPPPLGLAGASVFLTGFLESYMVDIEPTESWAHIVVLVLGLALIFLASWVPARRAAQVDPIVALKYE
jgi:putative ABC transport system permease protein